MQNNINKTSMAVHYSLLLVVAFFTAIVSIGVNAAPLSPYSKKLHNPDMLEASLLVFALYSSYHNWVHSHAIEHPDPNSGGTGGSTGSVESKEEAGAGHQTTGNQGYSGTVAHNRNQAGRRVDNSRDNQDGDGNHRPETGHQCNAICPACNYKRCHCSECVQQATLSNLDKVSFGEHWLKFKDTYCRHRCTSSAQCAKNCMSHTLTFSRSIVFLTQLPDHHFFLISHDGLWNIWSLAPNGLQLIVEGVVPQWLINQVTHASANSQQIVLYGDDILYAVSRTSSGWEGINLVERQTVSGVLPNGQVVTADDSRLAVSVVENNQLVQQWSHDGLSVEAIHPLSNNRFVTREHSGDSSNENVDLYLWSQEGQSWSRSYWFTIHHNDQLYVGMQVNDEPLAVVSSETGSHIIRPGVLATEESFLPNSVQGELWEVIGIIEGGFICLVNHTAGMIQILQKGDHGWELSELRYGDGFLPERRPLSQFLPETGQFILGRNLLRLDSNRYVSTAIRSDELSSEEVFLWTRNHVGDWSYQILYSMPEAQVESMMYMPSGQLVIASGDGHIVVIRVNENSGVCCKYLDSP